MRSAYIRNMSNRGRPAKSGRSETGKRIAEARERLGMTQTELAKIVGVSQPTIAFWEREASAPRGEYLPALAEALGTSVDALLVGDEEEHPRKRGPASKLERQLDQIRQLPKDKQKAISTVLDMALQSVVEQS